MARNKRTKKTQRNKQVKSKNKSGPKSINMAELANKVGSMVLRKVAPPPIQNSFLGNLGQVAGNGLSKIFGLGAYTMTQNSLWDHKMGTQVPVMHSTSESIRFRHREYLGDITSSTLFQSQIFNINPGIESTFPFLSLIASNFQEYQFKGLVFYYKSTSSPVLNAVSTAMGTVSMVAQYRADAPALTSKLQILNEMWAADGRPSDDILLPVECSPRENPMAIQYVRTGLLPAGQDIKLFDLAKVVLATAGQQTPGNTIGELWCSYDIELYKPVLGVGLSNTNDGVAIFLLASVATGVPLGSGRTPVVDTIGLSLTTTTITFPPGSVGVFVINWFTACTAGAITNPTVAGNTFATVSSLSVCPNNGTISDKDSFDVVITLNCDTLDDVPIVTLGPGVLGAGPLAGSLRVYQVNSAII
jgi:hypothetical protein